MSIPTITNEECLASCAACKTANTMIRNEDQKKEEVVESVKDQCHMGRMKDELEDLRTRIEALHKFINAGDFEERVPNVEERYRLKKQHEYMSLYANMLKQRIDFAVVENAFDELVMKEGSDLSHGSGSEYQFSAQTLYEFAEKIALAAIHDNKIQNSLMNQ